MAVISIYAIDVDDSDMDWQSIWDFVEENYGTKAICKNVLESDSDIDTEIKALSNTCVSSGTLNQILIKERDNGATHAFVQPIKGSASFGISLNKVVQED